MVNFIKNVIATIRMNCWLGGYNTAKDRKLTEFFEDILDDGVTDINDNDYPYTTFNSGDYTVRIWSGSRFYSYCDEGTIRDITSGKIIYSWSCKRPEARIIYELAVELDHI